MVRFGFLQPQTPVLTGSGLVGEQPEITRFSMTETGQETTPQKSLPPSAEGETPEDPGILESVGTFPVWMLRAIDTVTPDFLRTKEPPRKNYRI